MTFASITIDLNPNLIQYGPITLTWHGVFSVLGILATIRLAAWLAGRDGFTTEQIYDGAFWAVIVGLVGARAHFVLENWRLFAGHVIKVFYVNEGGISQWGGVFGGMVGLLLWAWWRKFSFWKLLDAAGPAALLGLAIGRIGDVINGEHHGTPTNLPWGFNYVNPHTLGQPGISVHPEVAYEMILCLGILALLMPFYFRLKARLPAGVAGLVFLGIYAFGRFWLSYFRADQIEYGLRQAQWASLLMVVLALLFIPILLSRSRRVAVLVPVAMPEPEPPAPAPEPPAPVPSESPAAKPAVKRPPRPPARPRPRPKT
jgi:prolipoprotein diacylglyceryl transferase